VSDNDLRELRFAAQLALDTLEIIAEGVGSSKGDAARVRSTIEKLRLELDATAPAPSPAVAAAPVSEKEGSEGRAMPPLDPENCDPDIYRVGVSMGPFIMERRTADALVLCLRAETGWAWDWNFAAGRVVLRYLKPRAPAPPPSTGPKCETPPAVCEPFVGTDPCDRCAPSPRAQTGTATAEQIADDVLNFGWSSMVEPLPEVRAHAVKVIAAALHEARSAALRREERDPLRTAARAVVEQYRACRAAGSMAGFWSVLDDLAAQLDGRALSSPATNPAAKE
jgi:hypothetical protein